MRDHDFRLTSDDRGYLRVRNSDGSFDQWIRPEGCYLREEDIDPSLIHQTEPNMDQLKLYADDHDELFLKYPSGKLAKIVQDPETGKHRALYGPGVDPYKKKRNDSVQVHRFPTDAAMQIWATGMAVEASREGKQVLFVTPNDSARSTLFEHWNDQVEGRVVVAAGGHEELRRWRGQAADFVIVESANDLSAEVVKSLVDPILKSRPDAKMLVLGGFPYDNAPEGNYLSTQMTYDIPMIMHKENE